MILETTGSANLNGRPSTTQKTFYRRHISTEVSRSWRDTVLESRVTPCALLNTIQNILIQHNTSSYWQYMQHTSVCLRLGTKNSLRLKMSYWDRLGITDSFNLSRWRIMRKTIWSRTPLLEYLDPHPNNTVICRMISRSSRGMRQICPPAYGNEAERYAPSRHPQIQLK